jgi:hypothetical protein
VPKNDPALSVPVRGVPGDWRDCWDDPDDHVELRASAEVAERRQTARAEGLGVVWRQELAGMADALWIVQRSVGRGRSDPVIPAET